ETRTTDEAAIRDLVENWAKAVRHQDLNGILANHSPDILMFDVPRPLQSRGIEAYRKTWDLFFAWAKDYGVFDILEMNVTAGNDVAFVTALMRCAGTEANGEKSELDFRLTIGLRKTNGQWTVMHEHHSIPASDGSNSTG
ncbi:MAG: YybH family protein, partial [Pyrinomonadaceae bacterium]